MGLRSGFKAFINKVSAQANAFFYKAAPREEMNASAPLTKDGVDIRLRIVSHEITNLRDTANKREGKFKDRYTGPEWSRLRDLKDYHSHLSSLKQDMAEAEKAITSDEKTPHARPVIADKGPGLGPIEKKEKSDTQSEDYRSGMNGPG